MMQKDMMEHAMTDRPARRNPFVLGQYVSPAYSCGRVKETDMLCQNLANGLNTVLLSPRRMGKTALIRHLFHQEDVSRHFHCLYVDIYSTHSFEELVYRLGQAVVRMFEHDPSCRAKLVEQLRSLRITLSLAPANAAPSLDFSLHDICDPEWTLSEIFSFFQSLEKRTVIAIDEFQQIVRYKNTGTEAVIRSQLQRSNKANMVFAGSDLHVLAPMFSSYDRPFYRSATFLPLNAIDKAVYRDFAEGQFARFGKVLPTDMFDDIYERFDGRTWYVHYVLNGLFSETPSAEAVTADALQRTINNIQAVQASTFDNTLRSLSFKQKMLLMAIAKENEASEMQGIEFCRRYGLGSPATVQTATKALREKGLISKRGEAWCVEDFFFAQWMRKTYSLMSV